MVGGGIWGSHWIDCMARQAWRPEFDIIFRIGCRLCFVFFWL
jgi:hypothetical protein